MAAWVRQAAARETPRFTAIEVERGLPPAWRQGELFPAQAFELRPEACRLRLR